MRKNKLYIFIVLAFTTLSGFAQQDPQFTQYMYTLLPINPGYTGTGGICATFNFRQQWAGFKEICTDQSSAFYGQTYNVSPRDIMLTVHAPIKALHGGLGLSVYTDKYGHQNDIMVKLAYAFQCNLGSGTLGIGLDAELMSRKVNGDFWGGRSGDNTIISSLLNKTTNDMYVDISFGVYYQVPDKWYAGISATQLLSTVGGDKVEQSAARHFYAVGGYSFVMPSNPNWMLKPSALLKTDFKSVQLDATLLADWNNGLLWFGASYRIVDCVALLVGTRPFANASNALRGLELGVSYDINTSKLINEGRSFGGPEVMLKYCFKIVPKPTTYGYKGTRLLGNKPIEYR